MPVKPSEKEEEFFAREEFERKRKEEEDKLRRFDSEEKQRQKELHYMHGPKCGMELSEIEYKGLKVDKCFSRDGIWLDAGELLQITKLEKTTLDKILSIFRK